MSPSQKNHNQHHSTIEAPQSPQPPCLQKNYDLGFKATRAYVSSLPDPQSDSQSNIPGAPVPILQVGIADFKLPLTFLTYSQELIQLETTVSGTISLNADTRGTHMSRIIRSFYHHKDRIFDFSVLEEILIMLKQELSASRARLKLKFNYPIIQESLRSCLEGYQYYPVVLEGRLDDLGRYRKLLHFDFIYSSACPCSSQLAEHARLYRDVFAIPHSQRSKARISLQIKSGETLTIEEIQALCLNALKTETQVMVKREDEQAFAELNGAHMKFVEDAARLLYEQLDNEGRIKDFQIACIHLESLHSHNAVAVINKGLPEGFTGDIDDFRDLVC